MDSAVVEGFRLSSVQEHLWRLRRDLPDDFFAAVAVVEVTGGLDRSRVEEAVERVVACHEVLRTPLRALAGLELPLQVVEDTAEVGRLGSPGPEVSTGDDDRLTADLLAWAARRAPSPEAAPLLALGWHHGGDEAEGAEGADLLLLATSALASDSRGLDRLVAAIAAELAGDAEPDDELTQFIDVSEWHNELLESDETTEGRRYWREAQIPGRTAAESPFGPISDGGRPGRVEVALDRTTARALEAIAAGTGGRVDAVLAAAWRAFLARLGANPGAVAVVEPRRGYEELARALGTFAVRLPLVGGAIDGESLDEGLAAAAGRVVRALDELVAWQELFHWGDLDAPGLGEPFLPYAVEHVEMPCPFAAGAGEVILRAKRVRSGRSRLELVTREDARGRLDAAELRHDGTWLDDAQARRVAGWLSTFLSAAAARPERSLGSIDLLSEDETRRLIAAGTGVEKSFGPSETAATLAGLFEATAVRRPGGVAIGPWGGEETTWGELEVRSRCLAHRLLERGIGRGDVVGVRVERSPDMVVALLGVARAGAAFLPLDPDYPEERRAFMLADSGAVALVASVAPVEGASAQTAARGLALVPPRPADGHRGQDPLPDGTAPEPDDLAYLIYTSGSTGRPKGVVMSHRGIVNRLLWMQDRFPLEETDVVLQKTPYGFDASLWEIFLPLATGARLELALPGRHQDMSHLLERIAERGVTVLQLVPSLVPPFLDQPGVQEGSASLRRLFCGGEALPAEVARRARQLLGVEMSNLYGPTEAAIDAGFQPVEDHHVEGVVPLGRPIANARMHPVDPAGDLVPPGLEGEIWIGGAGLAVGYAGRPALTAERFVPDPWGQRPGERLYRSGDRGRLGSDGGLRFLGRIDGQLKLRGVRVEPQEVARRLAAHPAVQDAIVVPWQTPNGDLSLVAYAVPGPDRDLELTPGAREGLLGLANGLVVDPVSRSETEVVYREVFEEECYLRHGISLDSNACVVDVGANIGMFSLFVQDRAPGARVYAFEPLPRTFEALSNNVELYGLGDRVSVFECGLGAEAGTVEFTFYPNWSAMSGAYADEAEEEEVSRRILANRGEDGAADDLLEERFRAERHTCAVETLSQVIADHGIERIDLLKIDVEKAELDVLASLTPDDWDRVRQMVIEVHDLDGRLATVEALLADRGFEVVTEQEDELAGTGIYNLYARRPDLEPAGRRPSGGALRLPGALADPSALEAYLARHLPAVMVPDGVILLDRLPRTPSGKVDRRQLPDPGERLERSTAEYVAPSTPVEQLLATLWCELLGLDRVGVHDDFFEIGGHSLVATRLVSRVRSSFRIDFKIGRLFETPTVAGLAAQVQAAVGTSTRSLPPLEPVPRDRPLPASFAQRRLWFLQQLEPESTAYNLPSIVRLEGRLDVAALAAAAGRIVERHETLRTTFDDLDGEPIQVIHPPAGLDLPVVDLSSIEETEEREHRAVALVLEHARRPFDLARGPLVRALLLRLGAAEHIVCFDLHHVISDGWSAGVMVRELSEHYTALTGGGEAILPELPIQYADYSAWQREGLQGEILEELLDYWRERLVGAPQVLPLASDRPRPALPTYRGDRRSRRLPVELSRSLSALERETTSTRYMVLLAAFAASLMRHGSGDDLVIGTNVANRDRAEVENLIGFFVNSLVLRTRLDGRSSFREALARARETVLGAFAHQELPFDRLVEEIQPRRDLSVSPVYQVVFDLHHVAELGALSLPDLELGRVEPPGTSAKFDLTLTAGLLDDHVNLVVELNTDIYDGVTVERLLERFENLLASAVAEPDQPLDELAILSSAERVELTAALSGPRRDPHAYPHDRTLQALFVEQAGRTPERVAAVAGDERLSYAELERRSGAVAAALAEAGVAPGRFVGLYAERGLDFLAAMLGILRAGGVYVPVEPSYPADRVRHMIEDSAVPVLLTEAALAAELAAGLEPGGCPDLERVFCLDGVPDAPVGGDRFELGAIDWRRPPLSGPPVGSADDPAYMLYTSGSTGLPKGAVVRQDGAVNHVWAELEELGLGEDLVFVQSAPSSSDISVWQLVGPVLVGGRTVIVDLETVGDGRSLFQVLKDEEIRLVELVPAALRGLLEHAAGRSPEARSLPRLAWMMATGEAIPVDLVDRWFELYPDIPVVNAYGPTETADDVVQAAIRAPLGPQVHSLPIGRPIANFDCQVTDRRLRPVPRGVPGELVIGGLGVGNGYWGRPARTAEVFVPDPFVDRTGARLYRTGDLVRLLPDDRLEFAGRLDDQIKIRGFRIELGEVESALAAQPGIRESAVADRELPGGRALVAYCVPREGVELDPKVLRDGLKQSLPEHMVPGLFVALDALPLTPAGKVDRKRLPDPEGATLDSREEMVAPRDEAEERLAAIWCEVLRRDEVSVESDFFDLGGHSLLATQVLARVRAAFDTDIPLREMFRTTTIAGFARVVGRYRRSGDRQGPGKIRRVARQGRRITTTEDGLAKSLD